MSLDHKSSIANELDTNRPIHVLWVNEAAGFVGGCEQYIYNTANFLRERNVRSTLLYDANHPGFSTEFHQAFDQAYPMVEIESQIRTINPDVVYIHRLGDQSTVVQIQNAQIPTLRFFHDYQLFCPREHRYTTIGHKTCKKNMGMRCYFPCMGVINKSDNALGLRLNRVGKLRSGINANKDLDAYVVGSEYMAELVANHGLDSSRIHPIPLYALAPDEVSPAPREPDLIFFAGQLIRSKGLDTLLHAVSQLEKPARLMIAGRGHQEEMFRELADSLHLKDRVTFLGQIDHSDLPKCYSKAACVVVPSRYPETFGLIGPEAMRYGAPIVATQVGAIEEWLEDGVTGFSVPPNDPRLMADAIDRMLSDPQQQEAMGKVARERYEEKFMPERHCKELVKLFHELIPDSASHV